MRKLKWEYDLFLTNPSIVDELRIIEMFPSDPAWIHVRWRDDFGTQQNGPIYIAPSGRVYAGTVVVHLSSIMSSVIKDQTGVPNLNHKILVGGYLHIRTNVDSLMVPIEVKLIGGDKAMFTMCASRWPSRFDVGVKNDPTEL